MSKKVMRLLDERSGLMECRVCGQRHLANLREGGFYYRGSWQCTNGCSLEDEPSELCKQLEERGELI